MSDYTIDGWRVFATEQEALDYCDLTWAQIVYTAPTSRIPAEFLALKEALDAAADAAAGDTRAVDPGVIRSVNVVPLKGLDHLGAVVDRGYSRAWAIPRQTLDLQFGVPCLAGFDVGGPEPTWPPAPDVPPPPPPIGDAP